MPSPLEIGGSKWFNAAAKGKAGYKSARTAAEELIHINHSNARAQRQLNKLLLALNDMQEALNTLSEIGLKAKDKRKKGDPHA